MQLRILIAIGIFVLAATNAFASESVQELQTKIDSRNADISRLEKEIASYQTQIDTLGKQERSLSQTLKNLDLSQKKLQANISLTQDKIDAKNFEISQLEKNIGKAIVNISEDKRYISESFKKIGEGSTSSFLEMILAGQTIGNSMDALNKLALLQNKLQMKIVTIEKTKRDLEVNKIKTEAAKADLVTLQKQLSSQKAIILTTKAEQNKILKETKNSETVFQKMLSAKQAEKSAFEQELALYESQLKLSVNLSELPGTAHSIIFWPLDKVIITQYFGNTRFATANPQLYSGSGHNGLDLGASIGTPIKAALAGTIVGTGNTDIYPNCYSLGKWVLIDHHNGLSTLYAHLSLISVSTGLSVGTRETIGYSGNTGWTTGPHLHFGVYATSGIEIKKFVNSRNCKGATIPIAVTAAYLNPLSYLPRL